MHIACTAKCIQQCGAICFYHICEMMQTHLTEKNMHAVQPKFHLTKSQCTHEYPSSY